MKLTRCFQLHSLQSFDITSGEKKCFGEWKLRVACTVKSISLFELVSQKVNLQNSLHPSLCVCVCALPLSCSSAGPGIDQPPYVSPHTGSGKWVQTCCDLWVIHHSPSSNSISPSSSSITLYYKMEGWHPAGLLSPSIPQSPSTPFVLLLQAPQSLPHPPSSSSTFSTFSLSSYTLCLH